MNWVWSIRSRDGAANGLEFAHCTIAGDHPRVLVHAAPAKASVEVSTEDGEHLARADVDRAGPYSPMTLLEIDGDGVKRSEVWPADEHLHLPVLLAGGEAGVLLRWEHADDRSWWRWAVEFSNHKGRPADWTPPGQQIRR